MSNDGASVVAAPAAMAPVFVKVKTSPLPDEFQPPGVDFTVIPVKPVPVKSNFTASPFAAMEAPLSVTVVATLRCCPLPVLVVLDELNCRLSFVTAAPVPEVNPVADAVNPTDLEAASWSVETLKVGAKVVAVFGGIDAVWLKVKVGDEPVTVQPAGVDKRVTVPKPRPVKSKTTLSGLAARPWLVVFVTVVLTVSTLDASFAHVAVEPEKSKVLIGADIAIAGAALITVTAGTTQAACAPARTSVRRLTPALSRVWSSRSDMGPPGGAAGQSSTDLDGTKSPQGPHKPPGPQLA